jgi:pimeloyl-ACP methyl ester carboxylesterase
MQGIVFVPGISGSELIFENTLPPIWPPKIEDLFVYQELDELLDPNKVTVGKVIDTVLDVMMIYQTTENDLQSISNSVNKSANGPYLPLPYDWRVDLLSTVDALAAKIAAFANTPGLTEITIVAHSMGGLLTRLLLEWKYVNVAPPAWFSKITRVLFICTPHLGAPTALARLLGLEVSELVIQPDQMKKFAADPHFPAVYQLLPPPARGILFDTVSNKFIPYNDPSAIAAFGLSNPNLQAAQKYSSALNPAKKPTNVKYSFVYGTGQQTDERVNVAGLTLNGARPWQDDQGDGTVPSWSITAAATQFTPHIPTQSFPGDHVGILVTDAFRQFLYSYFGLTGPAPLVSDAPGLVVSLNKRSFAPGETIHALLVPDEAAHAISGSLSLSRVTAAGATPSAMGVRQDVSFRGGPVRSLPSTLTAPTTPGLYRLDFGGDGASHKTSGQVAGWFIVPGTPPAGS